MHPVLKHRTTITYALTALLTLGLACAVLVGAAAVPPSSTTVAADATVIARQPSLSVPTDGRFALQALIVLDGPASYLESRVQIRHPSGRLLFQKTQVRSGLTTGTVTIDYERELKDLNLEPGIYPIELKVRTQTDTVNEWVVADRLLLHAPDVAAVPVAIVACVAAAPSVDQDGRFTIDPASSVRARDDVLLIARWIIDNPQARATLALPGFLAEEWARAAQGYEITTPEGVRRIDDGTAQTEAYADALDTLTRALDTERLELAFAPYGAPDVGALQADGRLGDLEQHLSRGHSAYRSALGRDPSSVLVPPDGLLPASGLDALGAIDVDAVIVAPQSTDATSTQTASGVFSEENNADVAVMVTDGTSCQALQSSEASGVLLTVFERTLSGEATLPLIASVKLGPGQPTSGEQVVSVLADISDVPWLRFVTASQVMPLKTSDSVGLADQVEPLPAAPTAFWTDVNESRAYAQAFLEAVGPNDPDAQHASDLSLMAQSGSWAGPDLNWGSAERGRSLASAARRIAGAVLDTIELGASEITLSGTRGAVPISIMNDSDKSLDLGISTEARGLVVDESFEATTHVPPQENFITVPVDLGQSLTGRLTVRIHAGDVLLDEITVQVRASFLDRLVLVAGVAIVLVGMLLFIRRRLRSVDHAGTI
ncbi:MAG: hypothetical protein ACYC6C_00950 [Coriobacteriia bacterium]